MATQSEWRSTAMVLPDWGDCAKQLEVRDGNGLVARGEFWFDSYGGAEDGEEEYAPMICMADGADRSLYEFEDWRPHEEDRA